VAENKPRPHVRYLLVSSGMVCFVDRTSLYRGTEGTEVQVTLQASVCGICGEESDTSTDFLPSVVKPVISGTACSLEGY